MQGAHRVAVSSRFFSVQRGLAEGTSSPWAVGDRVQHYTVPGIYTVAAVSMDPPRLMLQHDNSTAPMQCGHSDVTKLDPDLPRNIKTPLHDYQQEAIAYLLQNRRAIADLRPGCGKTLIGLGLFLRVLHDPAAPVCLAFRELFVVVTQANLVEEVWAKQAHQHGLLPSMHLARLGQIPEEVQQLVVISFQMLGLLVKSSAFDRVRGTLWNRRVKCLYVDECHRLSGDRTWKEAVQSLSRHVELSAGATGTLFRNFPEQASNVCAALGLAEQLQCASFWRSENALKTACQDFKCIFKPHDGSTVGVASGRPPNPPWRRILYASGGEKKSKVPGSHMCLKSIQETLGCDADEAANFHAMPRLAKEAYIETFAGIYERSSKLAACVRALTGLYEGSADLKNRREQPHHKIFMTVMFIDTLMILRATLRRVFPMVKIFEYHGGMDTGAKRANLRAYCEHRASESHRSLLLMSVCAGKEGLNITNGKLSPTAHVEFSQAALLQDRFQLQKRVDRDGNPFSVQLLYFEGDGTEDGKTLARQRVQAEKHLYAGDDRHALTISSK